jgi:GNAT superfamily N-acetyltransferase
MAPPVDRSMVTGEIRLTRCRDPERIERILREDYFDAPIRDFSRALVRTAARGWFAHSDDIYLIVAEVADRYAGFVFGHTLGQTFWRKFARAHLPRHVAELAWIGMKTRWLTPLRRALRRLRSPGGPAATGAAADGVAELGLPRIDRPFAWSPESRAVGHIDLLFVAGPFRGRGLAPLLLGRLVEEMARRGVTLIESHVDDYNVSSLRSFLKANFEVFRTSGGDHYVRYRVAGDPLGAGQR